MRTSDILSRLAKEPGERLSVGTILSVLGDRSFAVLVVFLGLPNCIPMPPPIPTVSALLLLSVAVQFFIGRSAPYLPQKLLTKSVATADVARAVKRALPTMLFLERWSQSRLQWLSPRWSGVMIGTLLLILALCVLLAAPIIGQIPFGLAICLIGLGLVERDGILVVIGTVIGAVGLFLSASFAYAVFVGLKSWF